MKKILSVQLVEGDIFTINTGTFLKREIGAGSIRLDDGSLDWLDIGNGAEVTIIMNVRVKSTAEEYNPFYEKCKVGMPTRCCPKRQQQEFGCVGCIHNIPTT